MPSTYYKSLLDLCLRCDSAMEAARNKLTRVRQALAEDAVRSSVLEETVLKLSQWVDGLRSVVIEEIVAKLEAALKSYLSMNEGLVVDFVDVSEDDQVELLQEVASLRKAIDIVSRSRKQGLPRLVHLRSLVGKALVLVQEGTSVPSPWSSRRLPHTTVMRRLRMRLSQLCLGMIFTPFRLLPS